MISNRQYWLFMAVAALLIAALASYGIPQSSFALTAETAAKLAGGAGTLLILPAILVVPWRQVQLTKRSVTNTPLYAGTAVFAMMAFVALVGATISGG
ncbi:hypothetical protein BN1012_Phect3171 [Candidatus Phaeomarinobacter ectocarpi]|uniref:Uncharacterized protein n=1 Tax=Candidatus Phaeomarinibacter ectocarpi TaxID=1458461 RepID=X5MBA5_9HYPH|nr:hypothetical protein [Candidatus Phaeomarinobacter ectocarpi]CDO61383.1 hypothetical protein BN1012_Phect3171 [Candidatus Phaeomarinobacter ectocarpi]